MNHEPYEHTRKTFKHGIVARIVNDDHPLNPRVDYDEAGTMWCWHRRYNLGDDHNHDNPNEAWLSLAFDALGRDAVHRLYRQPGETWEQACDLYDWELQERYQSDPGKLDKHLEKHIVWLPLYLYDHSGITISTGAFSCPWDSGQVGFTFMTRETILKETGRKRLDKQARDWAVKMLEAECNIYDDYLTGNCWGYVIEGADGEELESCWGFLGDPEYCEEEACWAAEAEVDLLDKADEAEAAFIASFPAHEQWVLEAH
jgi:hypothetical protein